MIGVHVNVADGASPTLREIISSLTGAEAAELNAVGGRAAAQEAARYHRDFDRAGGWRTSGRGSESTRFGADVAQGWAFLTADRSGALIYNDADHYRFKVEGGTIRPKRVRYLTIPIIEEARGLRAETYVQNTGNRLFTIPGRNALFERVERGSAQGERVIRRARGRHRDGSVERIRRKGGIRAVYALVRSVTMPPMPEALPPEDDLREAYSDAWITGLIDNIRKK